MNRSRLEISFLELKPFDAPVAWLCLILIFFILAENVGFAQNKESEVREEEQLKLGFMNGLFSDVNIADALAATKVWATELKMKKGFAGPADALVFEDISSAMEALRNKQIDVLALFSWQYLKVKDEADINAYFVFGRGENITEKSLLVVNGNSGIETLEDLKNKNLLILNNVRAALGRIWLEACLMEKGIVDFEAFFAKIVGTQKSSKTVLPVFFGQADACLIHRSGFETMCELNPQLRKHLKIIGASPPLLPSLLCIRRDYPDHLKSTLVDALGHLHEEPRGLQILTLFKADKVFPFQESYLQAAKELLIRHSALKEQLQQQGRQSKDPLARISERAVIKTK